MSATPGVHNAEVNSHQNKLAVASASFTEDLPDVPMEGAVGLGTVLGFGYLGGMFGIPMLGVLGGAAGYFIMRYL